MLEDQAGITRQRRGNGGEGHGDSLQQEELSQGSCIKVSQVVWGLRLQPVQSGRLLWKAMVQL